MKRIKESKTERLRRIQESSTHTRVKESKKGYNRKKDKQKLDNKIKQNRL